jgi:hypothetical protein
LLEAADEFTRKTIEGLNSLARLVDFDGSGMVLGRNIC